MYVSKGSKEALKVLIVTHVTQESEVVFVAFTQHCIQSTVTQTSTFANSQASALNAGVSTVRNSP